MHTSKSKFDFSSIIKASLVFVFVAGLLWKTQVKAEELTAPQQSDIINDLKATGLNQKNDDVRSLQAELLIAKNEKKAMRQIQVLLKKYKGDPMEAGLWFRLAELYMRRAKADRFFEVNRESETLVKLAPKLIKKASAKRNIQDAVMIYDKIERRFPYFRDMDLVLFNSGFGRQQIGKTATARKKYKKLINNFKDSPLVPDSHLAVGEMLFEEKKYQSAQKEFESIKNYPQSRIYPYGRYKLAWTLYNLEQTPLGLLELEAVVDYSKKLVEGESRRLDLETEALADMVLFYSESKSADKAVSYFTAQAGEEKAGFYTLRLMKLYNRHSKTLEEKKVFFDMVKNLPKDEFLPKAYIAMVRSFELQRKRNLAVYEIERFSTLCAENSVWLSRETNKRTECISLVSKLSSNHAAKWHKLWKKNQSATTLSDYAERAYRNYLSFDLVNAKANLVHFEYANLLFQRLKFRAASDEYFKVAKKVKKQPMLHDTSYAAIFSLQKAVKDKWSAEDELRYVSLASHYLSSNPKGKYREDIEFKRAFIIYDSKRFDEAAPLLADLGERYKNKSQGIKAQDLYLDILATKKSFLTTKNYSLKLYQREKNKVRKEKLKKVYQESYFASVGLSSDPKADKPSEKDNADEFISFAKKNMDSPLAVKAWWNAVSAYKDTTKFSKTANLALEFYNKFPKSKLKVDALKISTQNFERIMSLGKAAKTSEILVELDKENASAWAKLAVEYSMVENRFTKAEQILKRELSSEKIAQQKWAVENLYKMALEKKDKEKIKYYQKFVSKLGIQPYAIRIELAELDRLMTTKKYPKAFKKAGSILKIKGDLSYYRAKARFAQAEILRKEFEKQSMLARPERAALVIQLKTGKLEKAQKAYQSAMKYKNPEVVLDSMIGLAGLYGRYAAHLRGMKLKGVEDKDAAAFYEEIESLVIPMEEREVDTLNQALSVARELKLGNSQLVQIKKKMDKLNMQNKHYFILKQSKPDLQLPNLSEVGS